MNWLGKLGDTLNKAEGLISELDSSAARVAAQARRPQETGHDGNVATRPVSLPAGESHEAARERQSLVPPKTVAPQRPPARTPATMQPPQASRH
mmetsp:Transcript_390/g.990  ORF Transcript_390/g.990 Transcript_390/m.990 type:complete len:94 (-) Transcript_390:177-458(-)